MWRNLLGSASRVRHTSESRRELDAALVADQRDAVGRYPSDRRLRQLVAELHENSDRFAELWDSGTVGHHEAARKTIDHPELGPLSLDCDILTVTGTDLRIMIYTAEPGSDDAQRIELLTVHGTQTLTE